MGQVLELPTCYCLLLNTYLLLRTAYLLLLTNHSLLLLLIRYFPTTDYSPACPRC